MAQGVPVGMTAPAPEAGQDGRHWVGAGRPALTTRAARTAARRSGRNLGDALLERCEFPPALTAPGTGTAPAVLAVSGGADSLALLVLATRAGLDVKAVHIDHGLRSGSAREAAVVAAAAAAYGAAFEARSVRVPSGPDLEARARQARYCELPPGVLTGHTMDDQAETVLLAMLRGAALDGLSGMRRSWTPRPAAAERDRTDRTPADRHPADRTPDDRHPADRTPDDRIPADRSALANPLDAPAGPVRPLLGLRRSETAALCAAEGLVPIDDPSNRDLRFRRNRVRHQLLPLMGEIAGRDLVPVLARQARLLGDDAGLLEALAGEIDATNARQLAAAPRPLARRAVRRWLRNDAAIDAELHPPTASEVARVLAVAGGVVRACELTGGRRVERHAGRLRMVGR